jgi:tetratricopeptide (TPR) repeat protein
MRKFFLWICLLSVLSLAGCDQMAGYERDIEQSTKAINAAQSGVERAAGYDRRGRAYAEKARFSHFRKTISPEEYSRLFDLAGQDHQKAIELDPMNAEVYFGRGKSYYFRAAYVEMLPGSDAVSGSAGEYFDLALADFTQAIVLDTDHYFAWDMKGLVNLAYKNYDRAIFNFTQTARIDPKPGRLRLADAYCLRGGFYQGQKKSEQAIADYEESISLNVPADGCSCDPYNPLAWLYAEKGEYEKGRDVVQKARAAKVGIGADVLGRFKDHP